MLRRFGGMLRCGSRATASGRAGLGVGSSLTRAGGGVGAEATPNSLAKRSQLDVLDAAGRRRGDA